MPSPLWTPSADRIARANLTRFMQRVNERYGTAFDSFEPLYGWTIAHPVEFWTAMWDFGGVISQSKGERVAIEPERMRPGAHFFPDARLNFAENALRRRGPEPAILFGNEIGHRRTLSFDDLYNGVAGFAAGLRAMNIQPGDRVAGYVPTLPETINAALGCAAVGAVWSSASPDFGVQGLLDRFGQIEPRILITAVGYPYGG